MLPTQWDAQISDYLSSTAVEAVLRLESWRGGVKLGDLVVKAGRVRWDGGAMRGLLDVDVPVESMGPVGPDSPIGPYGQVLRAWWRWPQIDREVACGWWTVSLPTRRNRLWWQVQADPAGPLALQRAKWTEPPSVTVSGSAASQLSQMCGEAGTSWIPGPEWWESTAADTECPIDTTVLDSIKKVLAQADGTFGPRRDSSGIIADRLSVSTVPAWTIGAAGGTEFSASIDTDKAANCAVAWYEVAGTPPTYVSAREDLNGGPRAVDGPFGFVPAIEKLDQAVSQNELIQTARRMLREAQMAVSTVKVVCRADPRREVGDIFRAVSDLDNIDAVCRCTAIELNAQTGQSAIEGAVITGTVNGISTTFTDLSL